MGTVLLGGGVVANTRLRERMGKAGAEAGLRVLFPSIGLCTDNGAMIAARRRLAARARRADRPSTSAADPAWSSR